MNLKLETEFSKAEIFKEVEALKKQIDDMRPLPEDVEGRVMQKLRLDWNYHSNAIEGNRLSYGETVALLMEGITAGGKPLKDSLDIKGHNNAILFLLSIIKDNRQFSESGIRAIHELTLGEPYQVPAQTAEGFPTTKRIAIGEYKSLPNHVKTATGEIHYYATPEETPAKMQELMEWYSEASSNGEIHPVVTAALFHHKFVAIHPFDDGNGRLSRILMNLVLMKSGYPPAVIKLDDRTNYYSLLSRADRGESWPFIEYIVERLTNSLNVYIKAINGGDIDEDDDIDKEIALFKIDIKSRIDLTDKKSSVSVNKVINDEFKPLVQKVLNKSREFDELFFSNEKYFRYYFHKGNNSTKLKEAVLQNKIEKANPKIKKVECTKVGFHYKLKYFKVSDKSFDIEVGTSISFDAYKYSIFDFNGEKVGDKYYHEHISSQEIKTIIISFVSSLKSKIEGNLS